MENKPKLRALIYCRTSGEESENESSLATQKNDCAKFCDFKNYEVIDIIQDNGYSGANLRRPGFQKVLQLARNKEFDYLVTWKLDRFSRKVLDALTILEEFDKLGIKYLSVNEPFLSTDSAFGKFTLQILSVIGELERENIKMRTQAGRNAAMRDRGHWHGSPPYGYDKDEEFKLVPNPDKIKIVKDLFHWVVYDGLSLNELAKNLNDRGVKTERGGKWLGSTIRVTILSNSIYVGQSFLRRHQKEELRIPYLVEPVISKELFERARVTLNSNRNSLRGKTKHPAYYSPYLYCKKCGHKMYPQGRYMKKRGLIISYSGNRNTKNKPKSSCQNCGWIKQRQLDAVILPEIVKITRTPDFFIGNMEDRKTEDL